MFMMSKKEISSEEMDTRRKSRTPRIVLIADGELHTHEEAQMLVRDLNQFETVHGTVVRPTTYMTSLDVRSAIDEAKPKHVARIRDDHNTHGWLIAALSRERSELSGTANARRSRTSHKMGASVGDSAPEGMYGIRWPHVGQGRKIG